MATKLLDAYGYPIQSRGPQLLDSTRTNNDRPSWPVSTDAIHKRVTYQDFKSNLSQSQQIWANYPVLAAATGQKAGHAIGRAWEPEFRGKAIEWGEKATDWLLNEWYAVCDVRGENFDFKTDFFMGSEAIDRDGNFVVLLTESETGYPQIQLLSVGRIGVRGNESIVTAGTYKGLRIECGVIQSKTGRPVAYRVLGSSQELDQDISARDLIVKFDPRWPNQLLGFPSYTGSIPLLRDNQQSHAWEMLAQLNASSMVMMEHNEAGGLAEDAPENLGRESTANSATTLESRYGGAIRYAKAGTGAKIDFLKNDRPGEQWTSLQDRGIRMALGEMGWSYSLCWKPDGANGTAERSEIEKARNAIRDRQDLLEPTAKRIVGYAISKAIKMGILPPYPGDDIGGALMWGFSKPAEFNIDHGRESQQIRENIKMGLGLVGDFLATEGRKGTVKDHWRRKAIEQAEKAIALAEVEKEYGVKIDPREIQMFTPNDQSQEQQDNKTNEKP